MCGIAGMTRAEAGILGRMLARQAHRGPDDSGTWIDEGSGTGLGHARLAVIDLSSGGHQPMFSPCGRFAIAFNGEIYNYRDLRSALEQQGVIFRTSSDTEVLLHLIARDGTAALEKLVGMFAFAVWDRERRELLLVRDRVGIKPLVWASLPGGELAFASEIHALAACPGIDLTLDREALSQYLACLYVPAPLTIHAGIRKLPPGHLLRWSAGSGVRVERWWAPAMHGVETPVLDTAVDGLERAVREAVTACLVADVPVGCFLSGGVDSSVIAAIMAEEARRQGAPPPLTFTMTFDTATYDESAEARAVAHAIGSRHTELRASARLTDRLDAMVTSFGEPFGNPTALLINDLSALAREHVTVALVGDGGDEVFAGYPRYQGGVLAERYRALAPSWLRRRVIEPLAGLIPESSSGRHSLRRAREFLTSAGLSNAEMYAAWVEYFTPDERRSLLGLDSIPASPIAEICRQASGDDVLDVMQQTDLLTFLPGNLLAYGDAMSMAHALELRLPLLDHRLIESVQRIAPALRLAEGKKTLLRGVARRLLPQELVDRPKRGFNPPMGIWLKRDLASTVAERLTPARLAEIGLEPKAVRALLAEQAGGRRDVSLKVWSLLVLEAWDRQRREAV